MSASQAALAADAAQAGQPSGVGSGSIGQSAYALYRASHEAAAADGMGSAAAQAEQAHFESLRNQVSFRRRNVFKSPFCS